MRNKKRMLLCGFLAAMMLSSVAVNAAEPRNGVKDCTANLNLNKYNVQCTIFEGGTPMNPITSKSISGGEYITREVSGYTRTLALNKSVQTGQLSLTVNAPTNYISKSAKMPYFLNGTYKGTLSKTY